MEIHQHSTGQRICDVELGQTLRPGGKSGDLLISIAMLTNHFDRNRQKSITWAAFFGIFPRGRIQTTLNVFYRVRVAILQFIGTKIVVLRHVVAKL